MFNSLSEKLEGAFKVLKGQGQITEINIAETTKEIRRALLDADVSYKVAKDFTSKVKDKANGTGVINAVSPGQMIVSISAITFACNTSIKTLSIIVPQALVKSQ